MALLIAARSLAVAPGRGQTRGLDLNDRAQLEQTAHQRTVAQDLGVDAQHRPRLLSENEHAHALARLHHPFEPQFRDRFAHHVAADAERFRQLAFGRETVARPNSPGQNLRPRSSARLVTEGWAPGPPSSSRCSPACCARRIADRFRRHDVGRAPPSAVLPPWRSPR